MPNTTTASHCHLTNGDHPHLTENETPMAVPNLNSRATAGIEHRSVNTHLNTTGRNPVTIHENPWEPWNQQSSSDKGVWEANGCFKVWPD
ncbi:hypothetical protein QQF64_019666 [Cirrhinus molitorella]|uniref:Uncharacterized protein n=1 Tax=Cirrhinus molitorella TaxID=172907 RepID=A0ABR3LG73_9TELE